MASNSSPWNTNFNELFGCLGDKWNISEGNIKSLPDISVARYDGWKQFQDKGKVHFECGVCKRSWTSVNGAVIFHYRLKGNRGEVKCWCFGQKCNRQCSDMFEDPFWYETEIKRALENMLIKVKEKFYEGPKKAVNANQLGGKMSAGHENALCLACQKGVCGRRDGYSSGAAGGSFREVHYGEVEDDDHLDHEDGYDDDDDYDSDHEEDYESDDAYEQYDYYDDYDYAYEQY